MTVTNTKALPYDVIVDIISRLPIKLIIGCKILSKALNDLISDPSFSQIYLTKTSNSFCTLNLDISKPNGSLNLLEIDQQGNPKTVEIFNTERLPGGSSRSYKLMYICSYCNGLICVQILESGVYKPFVMNPILSEFIQLPGQVSCGNDNKKLFSYGLGHCQLSNRYKVLRLTTVYIGGTSFKTNTEIFTIGSDQSWRSVSDVNVPYDIQWGRYENTITIPLHSALHWFVYPVSSSMNVNICAFDMTEEKTNAFRLPPGAMARSPYYIGCLDVLSDKLCFLVLWDLVIDLWVMDEYGVEGSWTKKLALNTRTLPCDSRCLTFIRLTVSPGGVISLADCYRIFFYDMKKEIWLREIHRANHYPSPVAFVPNFVSLRNLVQFSGSMTDVPPCSLGSEAASAPSDDQLQ